MAISLSELTGASTSGNVLNEVNSYADFLDSCPRLVNKADPTGNTDAVQTVATKQPIALPLIDGDGYLFCSGINGNYAQIPDDASLDITGDLVIDVDVTMKSWSPTYNSSFCGKYLTTGDQRSFRFLLRTDKKLQFYFSDDGTGSSLSTGLSTEVVPFSDNQRGQVRLSFNSSTGVIQFFTSTDKGENWTQLGNNITQSRTSIHSGTADLYIGAYYTNSELLDNAALHSVKFYDSVTPSSSSLRFNCDFTSPRIPHGASEFLSDSGHQVRVVTSGNNPSKVIKKSVLRYDGVDDFMNGVFGQTVTGGYFFVAFSVNGDGGESFGHIIDVTSTGQHSGGSGSFTVFRSSTNNDFRLKYDDKTSVITHLDVFDAAVGDIMFEGRMEDGSQITKINNADEDNGTTTFSGALNAEEFVIAADHLDGANSSIDLEYLAFFPTLSDSQADQIRNFINNRNKVFYRWDTDGYYFFDGAATDDGQVFTGSGSWNGRIVGSDNGDSDFYISQNTLDDRPTTDGYKITFADNTDHFDIPSTSQAGWQIVGTSKGTFAYKVNDNAITELTMLGNAGTYRAYGDLYGIILLPESATNRDIEEARKLLIDRGALDAAYSGAFGSAWLNRTDIVEFRQTAFQGATTLYRGWKGNSNLTSFSPIQATNCYNFTEAWMSCSSLTQFPSDAKLGTEATNVNFTSAWRESGLTSFSTPLPTASRVDYAWYNNTSLSSFTTTDLKNCSNFDSAWRGTSSLKSFPNAQLGTEATNVNFQDAWRDSGLTSFPALDLSKGTNLRRGWFYTPLTSFGAIDASNSTNFTSAWHGTALLTSFPADAKLGTETSGAGFSQAWHSCGLTSFSTPLQKGRYFYATWFNNTSLTDFSADVFTNWNPDSITNGVFDLTWDGCTSLTAQSVENILVPIANSGKWATTNGLEGGTALTDATIDIDYDVSTGSLTAATLSAIETLNGRGWSVNINNEIIVPNILQLQPAAAYSLRSFDADADPTVVNVRRSSDGALSDFTASQVSDGTLTSWVNAANPQVMTNPDITSASGWTLGPNTTYNASTEAFDLVGENGFAIRQGQAITGQTYQVTLVVTSVTSGGLKVYIGGMQSDAITTAGTYIITLPAGNLNNFLGINPVGTVTASIASFHAVQTTADGYVTTWYDQSGSGNNSTQSTASSQPLIVENGVLVTENGKPAIYSDETFLTNITRTATNEATAFIVHKGFESGTSSTMFGFPADSNKQIGLYYWVNDNQFGFNTWSSDSWGYASALADFTSQSIWSALFVNGNPETSGVELRRNGVDKTLSRQRSASNSRTMDDGILIGTGGGSTGNQAGNGYYQEIVILDGDKTDIQQGIEKNINDHFNIY